MILPPCPACGAICQGHTRISGPGDVPREGDLSVCAQCFSLIAFGEGAAGLTLRLATDGDREKTHPQTWDDLLAARSALVDYMKTARP